MKRLLYILTAGLVLTGCGGKEVQNLKEEGLTMQTSELLPTGESRMAADYVPWNEADTGGTERIDTTSAYSSSFRKQVGEEKEVVYLGMPRKLSFDETAECQWDTSDETVATVENGIVTGWREGIVTVRQIMEDTKQVLDSWEFVITTFNDGKQAGACYESGQTGFQDSDIEYTCSVNPAFLKTKINTIQDAICYFQASGFRCQDAPVLVTGKSNWIWTLPGEAVLWYGGGGSSEIANAASYLLQYDFEDWGFILKYGEGSGVCNWFYEDGTYYVMDFGEVLVDASEGTRDRVYQPFQTNSVEGLKQYILDTINTDKTFAVVMVSALGHADQPAAYWSFLHDAGNLYESRAEVGYEETVYNTIEVLYESKENPFSFRSFRPDEIPDAVPCYDTSKKNRYHYEPAE